MSLPAPADPGRAGWEYGVKSWSPARLLARAMEKARDAIRSSSHWREGGLREEAQERGAFSPI